MWQRCIELIVQDFLDLRIRLLISFENNNFFFKILGSTGGIVNPNIFGIHVTSFVFYVT